MWSAFQLVLRPWHMVEMPVALAKDPRQALGLLPQLVTLCEKALWTGKEAELKVSRKRRSSNSVVQGQGKSSRAGTESPEGGPSKMLPPGPPPDLPPYGHEWWPWRVLGRQADYCHHNRAFWNNGAAALVGTSPPLVCWWHLRDAPWYA